MYPITVVDPSEIVIFSLTLMLPGLFKSILMVIEDSDPNFKMTISLEAIDKSQVLIE